MEGRKKIYVSNKLLGHAGSLGLRFRPCLGLELGLRQEANSSRCSGGVKGRISGGVVCAKSSYQNTCLFHWDNTGHQATVHPKPRLMLRSGERQSQELHLKGVEKGLKPK